MVAFHMKPGDVACHRPPDPEIQEADISSQGAKKDPYPVTRVAEMMDNEWRQKKAVMLEHAKPAQFDSTFRRADGNACRPADGSSEVATSAKRHTPHPDSTAAVFGLSYSQKEFGEWERDFPKAWFSTGSRERNTLS